MADTQRGSPDFAGALYTAADIAALLHSFDERGYH